jgi:hypothetical protein
MLSAAAYFEQTRRFLWAILVTVAFVTAQAKADDDWKAVFEKTNEAMFDCFSKEMKHAAELGLETKEFVKVLDIVCGKYMELWGHAVYGFGRSKGKSDDEIARFGRDSLAKHVADVVRLYDETMRKAKDKK